MFSAQKTQIFKTKFKAVLGERINSHVILCMICKKVFKNVIFAGYMTKIGSRVKKYSVHLDCKYVFIG